MRDRDWYNHAIESLKRIKSLKKTSPLGMFTSPEEYMTLLEDFIKLIYGLNAVSEKALNKFRMVESHFDSFKSELFNLCDILLIEAEKADVEE